MSRNIELTRKELYDHVWETPIARLAADWGISDVGLAKICKRHKIPRPKRGHWAKKQHGKSVRKTQLPKTDKEDLAVIQIHQYDSPDQAEVEPVDDEIEQLINAESDPAQKISVPEQVQIRHPLVWESDNTGPVSHLLWTLAATDGLALSLSMGWSVLLSSSPAVRSISSREPCSR